MAKGSVNKVILIGNLGRDPEVRYTPNGLAIANATIATTEAWKDKQSGENQERTEWHRLVFYNRLAEITGEYLRKGSKIYIEGRLQTRKWQDQASGQDRYTTEIIVDSMQMLSSKIGTGDAPSSFDKNQEAPPAMSGPHGNASATGAGANVMTDDLNDDIPF